MNRTRITATPRPLLCLLGLFAWLIPTAGTAAEVVSAQFVVLDQNQDGLLDYDEALSGTTVDLRILRHWRFYESDTNDDDRLTVEEYCAWAGGRGMAPRRDFLRRDVDHSGELTAQEFHQWIPAERLPGAMQNHRVLDFDGNGRLSLDEFRALPAGPLSDRGPVPDPIQQIATDRASAWDRQFMLSDRNGDGRLEQSEWPAAPLKEWGPPGLVPFAAWDANHDDAVTPDEGRLLIDVAYGIRRIDGEPIRLPTGLSVDWVTVRRMDTNHDGQISSEEFGIGYWAGPEKAEPLFKGMDANGDGQATLAEIRANGVLTSDVLGYFLWLETSLDGELDQNELLARCSPWQKSLAVRLVPAFDSDGNGQLSFLEFRRTPLANPATDWYYRRHDANSDGKLEFSEYYKEPLPELVGQYAVIFAALDRDHGNSLTYDELEFDVDWTKVDPNVRFAAIDRDRDGRLTLTELFSTPVPAGDAGLITVHERLRQYHQSWLEQSDTDRDKLISRDEFAAQAGELLPSLYKSFLDLDADGNDTLSYAEYIRPTLGSKWEPYATAEAPLFDVNDDGALSWIEFQISPRGSPTVQQRFAGLDADNDTRISESEFLHIHRVEQRREGRRGFCRIDTNGDGFADREEWIRQGQGSLSVQAHFRSRDDDRDGLLTLEEFLAAVGDEWLVHGRRDFRVVDRNGDRRLNLEEFRCAPGVTTAAERGLVSDVVTDWAEQTLKGVIEVFQRRDSDGDGRLRHREWSGDALSSISKDLAFLAVQVWDRDHDGYITSDECRAVVELAYGLRLPNGAIVRLSTGRVVNVAMLRQFDANQDLMLAQSEFVTKFWQGPVKSLAIFKQYDTKPDGRWDWDEIQASPEATADVLGQFLWFDTDLDGLIDQRELDAKMATWQKSIGSRLIRAFCSSGDGRMSLADFRATPFANPVADWYAPRSDRDHDARLSWSEYYDEKSPPSLILLFREYFNRFDLDHDGFLTYDELEFNVDMDKVTPEISFRMQDKDGDGRLVLLELFNEPKPTGTERDAMERYEMRLGAAETRFLADDVNRDGALDVDEYRQSREAALRAVERKTRALSRQRGNQPSNLPFIAFVILDVLILLGAAWYLWQKTGNRNP